MWNKNGTMTVDKDCFYISFSLPAANTIISMKLYYDILPSLIYQAQLQNHQEQIEVQNDQKKNFRCGDERYSTVIRTCLSYERFRLINEFHQVKILIESHIKETKVKKKHHKTTSVLWVNFPFNSESWQSSFNSIAGACKYYKFILIQ